MTSDHRLDETGPYLDSLSASGPRRRMQSIPAV
jgi:hypothetical protein